MFLEDQRNSRAVLLCDCGCGKGLQFQYFDGTMYIDFLSQMDDVYSRRKRIRRCFFGNKLILDAMVQGHDVQDLAAFLEKYPVTDAIAASGEDDLKITCEWLPEEQYEIDVYSTQSKASLIKNHGYVNELVPSRKTEEALIQQLKAVLKEHPPVDGITINGWR